MLWKRYSTKTNPIQRSGNYVGSVGVREDLVGAVVIETDRTTTTRTATREREENLGTPTESRYAADTYSGGPSIKKRLEVSSVMLLIRLVRAD